MSSQTPIQLTKDRIKPVTGRKAVAIVVTEELNSQCTDVNWQLSFETLGLAENEYESWRANRRPTPIIGVPYMPSKGRIFRAVIMRMNNEMFMVMVNECLTKRISPLDYVYTIFIENHAMLSPLFPPENEGIEFRHNNTEGDT